jgi:hypothetical protein
MFTWRILKKILLFKSFMKFFKKNSIFLTCIWTNIKKFCEDFVKSGKCQYGEYCALAHSDLELKIKPLHLLPVNNNFLLFEFKSVFCPFSKLEHDRYTCVYAHNWQDFKRPFFHDLKPIMCKAWDKEKEILVYTEGKLLLFLFNVNNYGCNV